MWHLDIPCNDELRHLSEMDGPVASVYLPTTPVSPQARKDAMAFRNLADTVDELQIRELLLDLVDDDEFWDSQAHGLGVIATPARMWIYRMPYAVPEAVQVADRAKVLPLIGAASTIRSCHVLLLSEGGARLIDVAPDLPPQEVRVPGMPADAASAVGKASIGDRSPSGRLVGSEGKAVHIRAYARAVDEALRPLLHGDDRPLVLVAPQPVNAIFRSVCSYPHLLEAGLETNADAWADTDVPGSVAPVLDVAMQDRAAHLTELIEQRRGQNRVLTDLADIARAASMGAVDTLVVDRDANEGGSVDEAGAVTFTDGGINVIDEVARRVLATGGTVRALPADQLPSPGLTAVLRWTI